MPSPGAFKGADADPEATLELFVDYLDKMEKVFWLSRGYNPVTGVKVDWDSKEKKDLLLVEGGDEVTDLFKYVGKVLPGDTYDQAVEKVKVALKKRGNQRRLQAVQHPLAGLAVLRLVAQGGTEGRPADRLDGLQRQQRPGGGPEDPDPCEPGPTAAQHLRLPDPRAHPHPGGAQAQPRRQQQVLQLGHDPQLPPVRAPGGGAEAVLLSSTRRPLPLQEALHGQ